MSDAARDRLVAHVRDVQARWRQLVTDVGEDRMEQPGAMGDWTFKDVASHLTGWRRRTILRLTAAGRGEPEPPNPWPADLGDLQAVSRVLAALRESARAEAPARVA